VILVQRALPVLLVQPVQRVLKVPKAAPVLPDQPDLKVKLDYKVLKAT
jgi:hypothetical protein